MTSGPLPPSASFTAAHAVSPRRRLARLPRSAALLAAVAGGLFAAFWLLDFYLLAPAAARAGGPLARLFALDLETLQNALGGIAEVIVGVLAIAITVVSIIVQLAATRYTPRVADMFFRDRTNLAIMGFFVVACLVAVWTSLAIGGGYVPRATVIMTVAVVTGGLLLLVPYFAHVFRFLDPERIIVRIGQQAVEAATAVPAGEIPARQGAATAAVEHLADVAVNALAQKDQVIASRAVGALRGVLVRYLAEKPALPPAWFTLSPRVRANPDFMALAADSAAELERQRVWLEWKILRHLRSAFAESLAHLPDMAHVVAIETRYAGEAALDGGDRAVVDVAVKYFNTYLRIALNGRDVRACYNILHQYRQLAERTLADGRDDLALEIGRHFAYYGQTAHGLGLGFVTETAAYDLQALCERAFDLGAGCHDALLRIFLEVDKEAETSDQEKTLRGVRKAQVKLATFYLHRGADAPARLIYKDMVHERPGRLASLRDELLAITAPDFWEVTDRGMNFDYLDEARRRTLDLFFGWFGEAVTAARPTRDEKAG